MFRGQKIILIMLKSAKIAVFHDFPDEYEINKFPNSLEAPSGTVANFVARFKVDVIHEKHHGPNYRSTDTTF